MNHLCSSVQHVQALWCALTTPFNSGTRNSYLFFTFLVVALGCTSAHLCATTPKDTLQYQSPAVTVSATRADAIVSPVTFNELSRTQILERHTVFDVPSLLSDLPSIISYSDNANGIGYSYLTLRGFDQRRISVMVNGIPQNDPEDHNVYWIDLPDLASSIDNIQVQRGAGLMNYGAAAIGGSINMNTINTTQPRFARLSIGVGLQEHGEGGLNAAPSDVTTLATTKSSFEYGSGLVDKHYAFYTRLSRIESRGYRDFSWANMSSYFVSAGRFDDDFTLQLNVYGGPITDGLAYTGLPKAYIKDPQLRRRNYNSWAYDSSGTSLSYTSARRPQEQEKFSQPHIELLSALPLTDKLTFGSSLFYYMGDGYFDYDASWADASLLRLTKQYGGSDSISSPTSSIVRAQVSNRQLGWIPRLSFRHDNGELNCGLEVRMHRSEHWANISFAENLPRGFDPEFRIYSYQGLRNISSIFASEQYNFSSSLSVNAEAQLVSSVYAISNERTGKVYSAYSTVEGSTITNGAEIFRINYLFFNPRLGMMYQADERNNVYLSLAKTQREPRMANLYAADEEFSSFAGPLFERDTTQGANRYDFSKPLIKPESLFDLELGWKFNSSTYHAAATFYFMDFRNELVKNGRRDVFGNPITGNAPKTQHAGIELQADAQIWKKEGNSLTLSANATFSRNRIIEYRYTVAGTFFDLSNNPVSGFPSTIANMKVSCRLQELSLDLSAKYCSSMYSDNFGERLQEYKAQAPGSIAYIDNKVDAFNVISFSMQYALHDILSLRTLRVRAQANNLLNTLYAAGANGAEFFAAAERNWFFGLDIEP